MPSYTKPTFNLLADFWQEDQLPWVDAPTQTNVPVQLYVPSRAGVSKQMGVPSSSIPAPQIRYDVYGDSVLIKFWRVHNNANGLYQVIYYNRQHEGFSNQYDCAWVQQIVDDGTNVPYYDATTYGQSENVRMMDRVLIWNWDQATSDYIQTGDTYCNLEPYQSHEFLNGIAPICYTIYFEKRTNIFPLVSGSLQQPSVIYVDSYPGVEFECVAVHDVWVSTPNERRVGLFAVYDPDYPFP